MHNGCVGPTVRANRFGIPFARIITSLLLYFSPEKQYRLKSKSLKRSLDLENTFMYDTEVLMGVDEFVLGIAGASVLATSCMLYGWHARSLRRPIPPQQLD